MIEKIEDVDGPGENAFFKHDQFFQNMGHGPKGQQQHENGKENQCRVRYLVQKCKHAYYLSRFYLPHLTAKAVTRPQIQL
jgi:hypothetical protein